MGRHETEIRQRIADGGIVFLQSAEAEWLKLSSAQGPQFDLPFERALELLENFPEMGPKYSIPPFRRLLLQDTYWAVFYTVTGDRVMIATILSLRQSPESIRAKLTGLLPE